MNTKFKMWSLFPFVARDISVWAKDGDEAELKKVILENAGEFLVKGPYLIDSFQKSGKTSYAFRLVFQSFERTLTDAEVNQIMLKISGRIGENSGWQVR